MTYRQLVTRAENELKEANISDYKIDAFYLFEYIFNQNRLWYMINCEQEVEDESLIAKYNDVVSIRKSRVPLQHITGVQEFMGMEFIVNKHVLVPRCDTEVLVLEALDVAKNIKKDCINIIDMCTGSGCIAISLDSIIENACVTGIDLSEDALLVAKQNNEKHETNVALLKSDLFSNISNEDCSFLVDMIVSNPPYIRTSVIDELEEEVRLHDPMMALDGMEDGLFFYKEITKQSRRYLADDGYLLYEIGHDQAEDVKNIMLENGFTDIKIIKDLAGLDRVVTGRKDGGNVRV